MRDYFDARAPLYMIYCTCIQSCHHSHCSASSRSAKLAATVGVGIIAYRHSAVNSARDGTCKQKQTTDLFYVPFSTHQGEPITHHRRNYSLTCTSTLFLYLTIKFPFACMRSYSKALSAVRNDLLRLEKIYQDMLTSEQPQLVNVCRRFQ